MPSQGRTKPLKGGGGFEAVCWLGTGFLLLSLSFSGCSCPKKKPNPPLLEKGCISSDAVGLKLKLDPNNLQIRSSAPQPVTSTLSITPVFEGGVAAPEHEGEQYFLDNGADGSFESTFSNRVTELTLTQPGRYAYQVTAVRCDGEILAARTLLNVLGTKPPILSVSFNPPFNSWLPLNVNLCAYLSAQDPDGGKEMDLAVTFGEGEAVRKHHDFASENVATFCHTYPRKGLYQFSAVATDPQGDTTTYTRGILIVLGIITKGSLDFGQYFFDLEFFGGGAEPPYLLMAGGESGVLSYRVTSDGIHFLSRLELKPDPAIQVRVDSQRRMGFVASGKAGGYFVDLTDPSHIRLIYPNVFYPPNARDAIALVDRVFLCQNGDWLVFRNRSLGLHFIEFRGEYYLQGIRDGSLAPLRENTPYFDFDPPLFVATSAIPYDNVLFEPNARGVACIVTPSQKWVAVSADGFLKLYKAPDPLPKITVPLPQTTPDIPARSEGVTGIANNDGSLSFFVAMGEHGFAEYRVVTDPPAASMKKHLVVYHSGLFFGNAYDRILDLILDPQGRLSLVSNSDLGQHGFMRWDLNAWPSTFSETMRLYPYRNGKCNLSEIRGLINNGDTYNDLKNCLPSSEVFRFAGKTDNFLWMRTGRGAIGLWPSESSLLAGTYYTTAEIMLPEGIAWQVIPDGVHLWVGKEKKLEVYDFTELESNLTAGFQPPPRSEQAVSIVVEGYSPVLGLGWEAHHLLHNRSELLWVTSDASGVPYPNGYQFCSGCFLEVAAHLGIGMARNLLDGTLRNFTLVSGQGIVPGSVSASGGYEGLFSCNREFFALKQDGSATLYRVTTLVAEPWITISDHNPSERTYACSGNGKLVYAALNPSSNEAILRIYPATSPNPSPEWSFALPYPTFAPPQGIGVISRGPYIVLFLKGNGYGLVFFNPSLGDSPDALLGVDLDGNAGLYEKVGLYALANGGMRLLALSPTVMGTRTLLIKEVR